MFSFPKLRRTRNGDREHRDRNLITSSPAPTSSPSPTHPLNNNPYPSQVNPHVTLLPSSSSSPSYHNASNSASSLPTIVYGARSCTSLFSPPTAPSTISTLYPDDSASNIGLPKPPRRPKTSSRHANSPSASSAYEPHELERDSYFHLHGSAEQYHRQYPPQHRYATPIAVPATGPAGLTLAARSQAFLVRRPSTFHELDQLQDVSHLMAPVNLQTSHYHNDRDRTMSPVALPQKALALLGLDECGSALGFGSPASPSPGMRDDDTSDEDEEGDTTAARRAESVHELYSPVVGEDALGIDAGILASTGTGTVSTPTTESALRSPATFMGDLEKRKVFRFQHLNPPPPAVIGGMAGGGGVPDRLYFRPESLCSSFSTSSGRTGRSEGTGMSRGSEDRETVGTGITESSEGWGWGGMKETVFGGPGEEERFGGPRVEVVELEGDFGAVELDAGTLTSESTVVMAETLSCLSNATMGVDVRTEGLPGSHPLLHQHSSPSEDPPSREYLLPGPSGRKQHHDGRNSNATNLGLGAMLNLDDSDSDSDSEIDSEPTSLISELKPPMRPRQPECDSPILPPSTTTTTITTALTPLTPPLALPRILKPGELPAEITARIVSYLLPATKHLEDMRIQPCPRCLLHTLHALSLTSKSWSAEAQKALYTIIPLDLGTFNAFTRTFTPYPTTCAHHLQTLSIEQRLPLLYRTLWDTPDTKPGLVTGIKLSRGMFGVTKYPLSAILQKCSNLEFLDAATINQNVGQKELGAVLGGLKNVTRWTWMRNTVTPNATLDSSTFPAITASWKKLRELTLDAVSLPGSTPVTLSPYPYSLTSLTLLNLPATSLPHLPFLPKTLSSLTITNPGGSVTPHLPPYLTANPTLKTLMIMDTVVEFDSLIPHLGELRELELLGSGIEVSGALVGGSEFSLGFGDTAEKVLQHLEYVKLDIEGGLTRAGVADFLVGVIKGAESEVVKGTRELVVVVGKEVKGEEGEWGRVWGEGVWGGVEVRRGE